MNTLKIAFLVGTALTCGPAILSACGEPAENPNPTPVGATSAQQSGATSGTGSGGASGSTTASGPGATTGTGVGGGGAGGCFKGAPMTNDQLLNACSDATQCLPFKTPLPKLNKDGTLPPLP